MNDATFATGTPIGDDYTPKASTVGLVDSQSVSLVWASILENLKTLDHPLPRNVTPATEEQILAAEKRMGYPMPHTLKEFYSLTNGIKVPFRWNVYVPFQVQFSSIDDIKHKSSYGANFESSMEMWPVCMDEFCMDNFSGGLLYQWDSSFDGQCGNYIIANSLADLLQFWDDELGKRIESIVATRDVLLSALSSAKAQRYPRLPNDIAFKIALYAAPMEFIRFPYEGRVPIDESVPHRFWFQKFRTEYERNFGGWPHYWDI